MWNDPQRQTALTDEQDLKEALDLAYKIIDAASCGILVYAATGQCIQANPVAAEIVGASVEQLLAENFRELPSWRESGLTALADAVLATGKKQTAESYVTSSFGRQLWLSCQLSSFHKDGQAYLLLVTKDVSSRHQAEEKVRQLSHAVEQSPASIIITDRAGNIEYVNPRFCQKTGYDLDEVLGKNPRLLKSGEMPATGYRELWKAISNGGEWHGDFHNRKKNGELFWEHASISPIFDTLGKISHYLAVKEDITEQKRTTEALIRSEQRYRTLFNGMTEGFALHELVCDASGQPCDYRFKEINPAFERITGLKSAQVLDRLFSEVLPGEDPQWLAIYAQVAQTGEAIHFEHYSMALRRHFEAFAYRTAPGHFAVMFQDITERKQAEIQLRDQARLLDLASDAIIVRDLEDRIQYWNKSAERIYGWSAAEALGQNLAELLQKDPSGNAAARKILLERGNWSGEFVARNRKGAEVIVEARWTLVRDHQGLPHAVLAINTDITQQKRTEEQLLRTQRLESIGTLAGGIAHDLNNVLAPIMMSCELLKMDDADTGRIQLLDNIHNSAHRAADLVRQILSFARGVEGRRAEMNPARLIGELQHILKETLPKSIELRIGLAPDAWKLTGDPTQLHQVLLNLCVNSRDAMPHGGILTIEVNNIDLDANYAAMSAASEPGPYVMFSVTDTGVGIPADIREKIFDPFFTTKEIGKGTGLGLSTTLAIVKSHGGFINLYSEPDRGTTFKIYLPARTGAHRVEHSTTAKSQLPRGRNELVLVVDDEASVRAISKQTLEAFGYRVLTACDGTEAIAQYVQHDGDVAVVLMDMMMPVLDGPASIHALTRMNPRVNIIAASGLAAEGYVAKISSPCVKKFLPKPYTAETLLRVLDEVLHQPANQ